MIKPKNKQELLKLLSEKTYKITLIEEGKAITLADQIKRLNNKSITVIVLE
jgi:vacuolar-type H+-ATPase subunit F/Vma7